MSFVRLTDGILAQAAPVVSDIASRQLGRDVKIGRLTHNLTVGGIWTMLRRPDTLGALPIRAENIVVGAKRSTYIDSHGKPAVFDEPALAGSPTILRARSVALYISLPALLGGQMNNALLRVDVDAPEVTLIRDATGQFNFFHLVKSNPNAKPGPPFRTYITLKDGRLHLRDYGSVGAPGRLMQNDLAAIQGTADLLGSANYRFTATAAAAPGTATVERLRGTIAVDGAWGRSAVGVLPDSPTADSARFLIHASATDGDAPYWLYYVLNVGKADPTKPGSKTVFRVTQGRADVNLTVAAPRPDIKAGPTPGIGISLTTRFTGGSLTSDFVRTSIDAARGRLDYADGSLSFNAIASLFGRPVNAAGILWSLTPDPSTGAAAVPQMTINVHAARLPALRTLEAVLPASAPIPPALHIGGEASLDGLVSGSFTNPVAAGRVVGFALGADGLPSARNIAANIQYTQGVLGATNVTATVDGGGTASGRGAMRVLDGGRGRVGDAEFAGRADGIDLNAIPVLQRVAPRANARMRMAGRASFDAVGTSIGGVLSTAANIRTAGLSVGTIGFPVAQARVLVTHDSKSQRTTVVLPAARLESAAGALNIAGNIGGPGQLDLHWAATALDLGTLATAAGLSGVSGHVTASGAVTGTAQAPRALIQDIVALNVRIPSGSAGPPYREFAADSIRGAGITVTRQGIAIPQPLIVRRFPARISVVGDITDLIPAAGAKFDPKLALTATVDNLEIAEIERQLQQDIATAVKKTVLAPRVAASTPPPPTVAGAISHAKVHAVGRLSRLRVNGGATLGNLLLGSYPLEKGAFSFSYNQGTGETSVVGVSLKASVGTLTGQASLLRNGAISGAFQANGLDMEKLSFLTSDVAPISGAVTLAGAFSGTIRKPVIVANLNAPTVIVAGVPFSDVRADGFRYTGNLDSGASRLDVPLLALKQVASGGKTSTSVELTGVEVNLPDGALKATIKANSGDIGALLSTLETSDLADTKSGGQIVRAIQKSLPTPVSGAVALDHLTVSGQIESTDNGSGGVTRRFAGGVGDALITATNLQVGAFTAPTVEAHASLTGREIVLDKLTAVSGGTTFRGHGTFGLDGNINAVMESNAASITSLRTLPPLRNLPMRGNVDLAVLVKGAKGRLTVTGSVQGTDLQLFTGPHANEVIGTPAEATAPTFAIDLLRAEGQYLIDPQGRATLTIPDAVISHGSAAVQISGSIPISTDPTDTAFADRPITLSASIPALKLADLAPLFASPGKDKKGRAIKGVDIGGTLTANVELAGSVGKPVLSGDLTLVKGKFALPNSIADQRDRINPLTNIDAHLTLTDDVVKISSFNIALGGPDKQKGDFGSLAIGGTVTLNGLSNVVRVLQGTGAANSTARLVQDDLLDLTVKFKNLKPVDDNLFGYGESVQGVVNGILTITGPLTTPTIATVNGDRIHIADGLLRVTATSPAAATTATTMVIAPTFNVPLQIDGKAVVTDGASFRFEANGDADIKGSLAQQGPSNIFSSSGLDIEAVLNVVGGWFDLPTARFTVKRSGAVGIAGATSAQTVAQNSSAGSPSTVTLRYNSANPGVIANNINAVTRLYVAPGSNISSYAKSTQGAFVSATSAPISGPSTAYNITATINGPLNILPSDTLSTGDVSGGPQRQLVTFTSVPTLTREQIIALLGTQEQLDQARNGDVTGALASLGNSVLYNRFLPQYLAPLTNGIQNALRLEDFSITYDPSGYSQVFLSKRFPPPLERLIAEYTQQLQTRGTTQLTAQQPFLFSLAYEVFQFKTTKALQPRLQVGFSTDDQRVTTYFLRSAASF